MGLECSRQHVSVRQAFFFHHRPSPHMHLQELPQTLLCTLAPSVTNSAFAFHHVFWENALHRGESSYQCSHSDKQLSIKTFPWANMKLISLHQLLPGSCPPFLELSPVHAGAHIIGGSMAFHLLCLVICKLAGQCFEGKLGQFDTSFPQHPGKWQTSTRIKSGGVLPLRQSHRNKILLKSSCPSCI